MNCVLQFSKPYSCLHLVAVLEQDRDENENDRNDESDDAERDAAEA